MSFNVFISGVSQALNLSFEFMPFSAHIEILPLFDESNTLQQMLYLLPLRSYLTLRYMSSGGFDV